MARPLPGLDLPAHRPPFQYRLPVPQPATTSCSIRHLRNRIAHHEPIFTRNSVDDYRRIHELTGWRSQTAAAWMNCKQGVTSLIPLKP